MSELRIWGRADDPHGECYIPLAPHKRKRSRAILQEIANKFSDKLAGCDIKFADGGVINDGPITLAHLEAEAKRRFPDGSILRRSAKPDAEGVGADPRQLAA